MRSNRPEKETVDHEVQTRIYIPSTNSDRPSKALSNRRSQTIITIKPDQSILTVRTLFQFLPQQEIDKGALREVKLPRAALLQWKLPLASYEQSNKERASRQKEILKETGNTANEIAISNITKGVLKKKESDKELDDWAALQSLSNPPTMADEQIDVETQTNFTVRPHVLGDDQVAQLAKASSLQTSLTFNPDASISQIQPFLTQDIDHLHNYLSTITPNAYVQNSSEAMESQVNESITEQTLLRIKLKEKYQTNNTTISINESQDSKNKNFVRKDTPYNIDPQSNTLQNQEAFAEHPSSLGEFVDMILIDLADKSIPNEAKELILKEFAAFNILPDQDYNDSNVAGNLTENKVMTKTAPTNQFDDEAFERVVTQIMNSCVYNIEDQLKRILKTFDTYQKDLQNMNMELMQADDADKTNEGTDVDKVMVAPLESHQRNENIGEGAPTRSIDMQGDTNLKHQVDVLCECCNLTAGGAAVPILDEPSPIDAKPLVTFDVIVGPEGIELQNNAKSSPSNGEQIIRFSIVPSRAHVDGSDANKSNSVPRNAFEIHVSCHDIPKGTYPSDVFGTDLGVGPEHECTVVLAPKRIMRTSEDNLNIHGTSQNTGMMFEQDAEYIEPYINNVDDITIPIKMLQTPAKRKTTKTIAKPFVVPEQKTCTESMEIPWDVITLQVISLEQDKQAYVDRCCREHFEPSCTRTFCPMDMHNISSDNCVQHMVQFDDVNEEVVFVSESNNYDMDYEPAVTHKRNVTASTSEIQGSVSDIFVHEDNEQHRMKIKRGPIDALVYDPTFDRHNEPYMDYMYNHFPDDNIEGNCGSGTEIPWELFTLPINTTIRKVKKPAPKNAFHDITQANGNTHKGLNDLPMNVNLTNIHLNIRRDEHLGTPLNSRTETPREQFNRACGIDMNITAETISNIFFVDGAAASQKSISLYSMISDFRYIAKRSPKNIAIGLNFADDGTISAIVAGSETFILATDAYPNDLSTLTMEIKPFTECRHKSEQVTLLKERSGETIARSIIGNILTESQSVGANYVKAPSGTPINQVRSMPEIPSRTCVTFPPEVVASAQPQTGLKNAKPNNDPIAHALDAYRAEMKPIREALDKLKEEVRQLNLPQLAPNYYGEYSQQYPNANIPYPGPIVRHITAVSNGCGTKTSTRMKPLFMQNMIGNPYNQLQYPPPPPGMPPLPYYVPSQQYTPMPYPVPGMLPYPQAPMNQQPSDLYNHQEHTDINPPSCKSRRRKRRNKEGGLASKDSQLSQQASKSDSQKGCKSSCLNKNGKCEETVVETHYGPKEMKDNSSEVSVKPTCYVINNNYKIEITPDQHLIAQKESTTTEPSHMTQKTSSVHTESTVLSNNIPQQEDVSPNFEEDMQHDNQSNVEEVSALDSNKDLPSI